MLTLDVEHANSTDTLRILGPDDLGDADTPSLQSARIERKLTRQPEQADTAEVVVYRDAWSEVEQDLDRTDDRLVIREDGSPIFGGRLADFERSGVVVSVLIDSPKRDAIDAQPSGGNDVYQPQNDSALLTNELLPRVPTVDAGTVETVDADIAFSESHASPGKSITKLARDADAEVRYRTTDTAFELDYVGRLGSDRTAETLSPSSATVLGEPRVREQVTEDVTHVRVLGAGEGTAQVEATAVTGEFNSADDRAVYRSRTDKDIQEQSRAQSLAETLVAEYDGAREYVEVEFEVPRSVDPSLGDEFTVQLQAHDIDTTLRVTTAERLVDDAGDRFRVVLSNRRHTADLQGSESAVELNSLSEGNAGQYYAFADGEGWDALDSGEPYQFSVYRPPNTIGELRSVLRVESRPYRLRAAQSGHSHSVDVGTTTANNSDFSSVVSTELTGATFSGDTLNSSTDTLEFTINQPTSEVYISVEYLLEGESLTPDQMAVVSEQLTLENIDTGYQTEPRVVQTAISGYDTPGSLEDISEQVYLTLADPTDCNGDTLRVQLDPKYLDTNGSPKSQITLTVRGYVYAFGKHTHNVNATETTDSVAAVDPGIVEQSNEIVSGVDVTVAGQTVSTGLDHPIDESIDLAGVLSDGRNDIEITSDSLGEIRATLEYEAIKNADSR